MLGAGWMSSIPRRGGCWYLHLWVPLAWGLLHRGCGGWYGIAAAVAGIVPALQNCRLQHLTRDELNQIPPERIKNGNVKGKFSGNRDMDPDPCWLLPRDRQGRQGLCQGPTHDLAPPAPCSSRLCLCSWGGQAGAPEVLHGWKHPSLELLATDKPLF